MAITKEEFIEGFKEAVVEIDAPRGVYAQMLSEFVELERDIRPHDVALGDKVAVIVTAIKDFGAYIKSRAET